MDVRSDRDSGSDSSALDEDAGSHHQSPAAETRDGRERPVKVRVPKPSAKWDPRLKSGHRMGVLGFLAVPGLHTTPQEQPPGHLTVGPKC